LTVVDEISDRPEPDRKREARRSETNPPTASRETFYGFRDIIGDVSHRFTAGDEQIFGRNVSHELKFSFNGSLMEKLTSA
jgi:hypothetical protein